MINCDNDDDDSTSTNFQHALKSLHFYIVTFEKKKIKFFNKQI